MKIAVVGSGNWGQNLVRTLYGLGALGAIVESDEKRRTALAATYPDLDLFSNLSGLSTDKIKAVAIATPAPSHFAVAKQALESGFDVFVEKPITLNAAQALQLADIAKKSERVLMVGHLLVYQPAIRWLSSFLKEGGIGKVLSFHQQRLNLGRARSVENALWSLGVHDVAVLLDLIGEKPCRIEANGQAVLTANVEDDVHLHLNFPSGVKAHLHVSWLWPERARKLTVVGDKGMVVFDELAGAITLHKKSIAADLSNVDQGTEVVFKQEGEPLKLEMQHFLDRLADRARPLSDGERGVEVVRVIETACAAMASEMVEKPSETKTNPAIVAHESAYVDEGARVGKGTRIWHFSHVSGGSEIGENCSLGQNVFVAKGVRIGNQVKIQNNVSLYEGVEVEDFVFCGPSMVFTNVRTPRSAFPRNTSSDYHKTRLGKGCSIGANATIVCGTSIGEWAFVAAGAVVTKDVPDFALMAGVPAKRIGWACSCGETLKLEGGTSQCGSCQRSYEAIDDKTLRRTDSLQP